MNSATGSLHFLVSPFLIGALLICGACSSSAPTYPRCNPLPEEFSQADLIGIWSATRNSGQSVIDTLIIRDDGMYKQIIQIEKTDDILVHVEADWEPWRFDTNDEGIGYLHLAGMHVCERLGEDACEWHDETGSFRSDYCMGSLLEPALGEHILIVAGFPIYDENVATPDRAKQFDLSLSMGFESSPWSYSYEGSIP